MLNIICQEKFEMTKKKQKTKHDLSNLLTESTFIYLLYNFRPVYPHQYDTQLKTYTSRYIYLVIA